MLKRIGFIEWSEYTDFWNVKLPDTLTRFDNISEAEYLSKEECEKASVVSQKCRLQSRGFEGIRLKIAQYRKYRDYLTRNIGVF